MIFPERFSNKQKVAQLMLRHLVAPIFRGLPEMIAQFATPVTTICMNRVLLAHIGEICVNSFSNISYVASFTMSVLFGANAGTLAFTVQSMPHYVWGFIVAGMNILISAYFYPTKRSKQAIILNVMRSLIVNAAVILGLPALLGSGIVWYTFGIYESIVLALAIGLLKYSERNGIVYQ